MQELKPNKKQEMKKENNFNIHKSTFNTINNIIFIGLMFLEFVSLIFFL